MKNFVLWRHYLRMTVKIRVANNLVYWQNAIWRRRENNHSKTLGGYFLKFIYTDNFHFLFDKIHLEL